MIRFSKAHALAMIAAVGLGSALVTTAQPPEGDAPPRRGGGDRATRILERFDENGDGKIEESEVPEGLWARFSGMDANKDGAITADELNAGGGDRNGRTRGRRGNPVVDALDADKDGTLSKAEIAAASTALLTLDKNGDGELTADELRPARGGRGEGRGERGRRGERGERGERGQGGEEKEL